ncbi:hypothetical protein [Pelomonas sp. KK5]|uniref:hypothetical protein n=1 Tax=Pelomonas sp. KK5 TaxID=1855730 RepID=UPI00097BBB12|nr:hypothetical protein [Pelomonas sp. KK5]
MPDSDEPLFRKDFKLELSKFRTKTKPHLVEALALRLEMADLMKADAPDDKRMKAIDLSLKKLNDVYLKEADGFESRVNKMLKDCTVAPKDARGLSKWYADLVDKESGLDIGKDMKLWGEVDFGSKEFTLTLKGKFSNP